MEIPIYPSSRPITLSDRDCLQEHFQLLQPRVSELSFANIFLFRNAHQYRLSQVKGSLVIFGCGYSGEPYFLPPVSGKVGESTRFLLDTGNLLYGADDPFLSNHLQGKKLSVMEDRNNSDYLYLREELAELPGSRYHKKKNRISYFTTRHTFETERFRRKDHLSKALRLLSQWQSVHETATGSSLQLELEATKEGLELADQLGLEGVVVLLEGRVAAFALGEQLNRETAVCHFEKADPFMEGLSQLINREFSRSLPGSCTFINREQDLGEAGLRIAKISYHPVSMVNKFRVEGKIL